MQLAMNMNIDKFYCAFKLGFVGKYYFFAENMSFNMYSTSICVYNGTMGLGCRYMNFFRVIGFLFCFIQEMYCL